MPAASSVLKAIVAVPAPALTKVRSITAVAAVRMMSGAVSTRDGATEAVTPLGGRSAAPRGITALMT